MAQTRTSTPLRYPGGKSQLYHFVVNTLEKNNIDGTYIEPFAGGAGIAIELLLQNKVNRITINDFDPSIYATWYAIVNSPHELIDRLAKVPFDYTTPNILLPAQLTSYWDDIKNRHVESRADPFSIENAFTTLMLNRMNVSGIISGGPIGGRKQSSKYQLDARFNKGTLIKKIEAISARSSDIDLYNLDANELIDLIRENPDYRPQNTFIFFDPPYYVQGKNLYLSFISKSQHATLAKHILGMEDYYWITTYDTAPQIAEIYNNALQKYSYSLNYNANKRGTFNEYLFASKKTKLSFTEKMKVIKQ